MKVTLVVNPKFQEALMKLSNQDLPLNAAKTVLSVLRQVQQASSDYHEGRIKFMSGLAEKNKDGSPKIDTDGNFVLPKEELEKINSKVLEMMNKEISLPTILESDLKDAKLTAQECSLLEGLFS